MRKISPVVVLVLISFFHLFASAVDWTTDPVVINTAEELTTTVGVTRLEVTSTGDLTLSGTAELTASSSGTHKLNGTVEINDTAVFGATAKTKDTILSFGHAEGETGNLVMNGGTFKFFNCAIGNAGSGSFIMNDGKVTVTEFGSDGNGDLSIGKAAMGSGVVTVNGGVFGQFRTLTIGNAGKGKLVIKGGEVTVNKLTRMAVSAGSSGELVVDGGLFSTAGTQQPIFADGGSVTVIVTNGTLAVGPTYAKGAGSKAKVTVYAGGVVGGQNLSQIFGGAGECEARIYGGKFYKDGSGNAAFTIGQDQPNGVVRGWWTTSWTKKMTIRNNGLVIADGRAEDGSVSDREAYMKATGGYDLFDNTIENTTTNGWYAVNKGLLTMQVLAEVPAGDTGVYTWGEKADDDEIDLVNSVRVTFTNITDTPTKLKGIYGFVGHLYAADRSDVPAGLNTAQVAGIWKFEVSGQYEGADLEVRYDHVKAPHGVAFYEYDGTSWVKVPTTLLPGHRAKVLNADLTKMHAAVAVNPGLTIFIQ